MMHSSMIPFYIFYLNISQIAAALPPCQLAVSSVLRQGGNLGLLNLGPPSKGDLCKEVCNTWCWEMLGMGDSHKGQE